MYEQCLKHGVKILADHQLLDLAVDTGKLAGVVALNIRTGQMVPVKAKAVVIATGGAGRMYWSRTTNPFTSTADGMAACFRAGIALKDPEMVQFHPTGLAGTGILMSEASRSEGGYLLNNKGERFMSRYAPEKMELATRDLVSQAIETEIREGRGFGDGPARVRAARSQAPGAGEDPRTAAGYPRPGDNLRAGRPDRGPPYPSAQAAIIRWAAST